MKYLRGLVVVLSCTTVEEVAKAETRFSQGFMPKHWLARVEFRHKEK
ncbi:MAG: hypothetical protein WBN92_12605 [Terriglobia bacterium]